MNTPFGPPFDRLELADVRQFFAEPRVEGLNWEAKGGQIRSEHVRNSVCAFANGFLDAYLLLGVDRLDPKARRQDPCRFEMNGWEPSGGEADTWVSSCLIGGLDPRPFWETKSWLVSGSRWVSVVLVRPTPNPPCITADGNVFERLPGLTSQVNRSEALRALLTRGKDARAVAEVTSSMALSYLWSGMPRMYQPPAMIGVAVAAPALAGDISSVLFRESSARSIRAILEPAFSLGYLQTDQSPDAMSFQGETPRRNIAYAVRVAREGSVALAMAQQDMVAGLTWIAQDQSRLERMWGTANSIARSLGGYGPAHVSICGQEIVGSNARLGQFARWSSVDADPDSATLAGIGRETARFLGRETWEPEAEGTSQQADG